MNNDVADVESRVVGPDVDNVAAGDGAVGEYDLVDVHRAIRGARPVRDDGFYLVLVGGDILEVKGQALEFRPDELVRRQRHELEASQPVEEALEYFSSRPPPNKAAFCSGSATIGRLRSQSA